MPCDATGGGLNPNNGYMGCVDPQPFFNGKFAQDIATETQIVEKTEQVVQLIAASTDAQISHQDKLTLLEKVEAFLKSL